jgi:hypothetical protein
MDKATAVARITETENLTGDLADADAQWLIGWGVGQVDAVVLSSKDETDAGYTLNQLMAVMRALSGIGGTAAERPPALLVGDLRGFFARYALAFGQPNRVREADLVPLAARIAALAPQVMMQTLLGIAAGHQGGTQHG